MQSEPFSILDRILQFEAVGIIGSLILVIVLFLLVFAGAFLFFK